MFGYAEKKKKNILSNENATYKFSSKNCKQIRLAEYKKNNCFLGLLLTSVKHL